MICPVCKVEFDPANDTFITINERKTASVHVDTLACATVYLEQE